MLASSFVKTCKLVSPMSYLQTCARRTVYWGHVTLEEKEAAKRKELEKGMVLKWSDPDQAVDVKKSTYYSPMRIEQEEKALSSGFSKVRFNVTDWFEFAMQPIFPWLMNQPYYHCHKRIKLYNRLIEEQRFVQERLIALGPDLSAAYFLIARGCRVMFKGKNHWFPSDSKGKFPEDLPTAYVSGWYIEKIDASDSLLIYEGLQNIRNLIYLKSLDLSYCPLIDEWCMDRITGEFGESLEVLNLSGCTNIDWNGLECLWRFRKLKTLILRDMDHVRDIKLICLMLLDIFPDLDIQGVDYIDAKLLEGTEHEELLKELDVGMTTLLPGPNQEGDETVGEKVDKSFDHEAKSETSTLQRY